MILRRSFATGLTFFMATLWGAPAGADQSPVAASPPPQSFTAVQYLAAARYWARKNDRLKTMIFIERAAHAPDAESQAYFIWLYRAGINLDLKDYPRARADAERAAAIRPDAANPLLVEASAFKGAGDLPAMRERLMKAVAVFPSLIQQWLASAYAAENETPRNKAVADDYANMVLINDPKNQEALDLHCDSEYALATDPAEALKACDAALATGVLEKNSYVVYGDRGSVKRRLKDFAGARADFEKCFALEPDPPAAEYYQRADLREAPGKGQDLAGALADVTTAISKHDEPIYHWLRGGVYEALGNWSAAQADFIAYETAAPQFKDRADKELAYIDSVLHPQRRQPIIDSPSGPSPEPYTYQQPQMPAYVPPEPPQEEAPPIEEAPTMNYDESFPPPEGQG